PAATRTFVQEFEKAADAIAARDAVLKSMLQPAAVDILKLPGGYQLLIQAGGSRAVLDRYSRELKARPVEGVEEQILWENIREFTPRFLEKHENGEVLRVSCALSEVGRILESLPAPALARAGSGVCYGYFDRADHLRQKGVTEFAPQS